MILLSQLTTEQLTAQLQNGVVLMLLGMGTVLLFLVVLIFVTKGLSSVVRKIDAKRPAPAPAVVRRSAAPSANAMSVEPEIAAAIAAAVARTR
ncbi:MAG: OadG family protein [Spirochaetaceae bacterium]|jgi:oxaloacetate decarboxylase gamma subunit|nr:OadG family protein [Spirochaetaceae bacterium]